MTDIVQRLKERGDSYGIPVERDMTEAAALIERMREALFSIHKASLSLRGEQSYRDFSRFARNTCSAALSPKAGA